ncbi:uncharacterized protein LOC125585866 [Brassica napus]|uniref:uncharacterized protein LOC125585866 n=1 Tax=Brassica napus TaxID=3708 RepID=UPI00207A849D|nr:uncharacterized protein LOC125585866 [Brassica napus]
MIKKLELQIRLIGKVSTWLNLQLISTETPRLGLHSTLHWKKPPVGILKCKLATSWIDPLQQHGSAWIVRDSHGVPVFHSRGAFAPTNSKLLAGLSTFKWAVEALLDLRVKRVCFEISSSETWKALTSPWLFPNLSLDISRILRLMHNFDLCQIMVVSDQTNFVATEIASSVTKDGRYQSYIATGGPRWLSSNIRSEAAGIVQV